MSRAVAEVLRVKAVLRRLLRAAEPFTLCTAEGMAEAVSRAANPAQRRCGAMSVRNEPYITPRRFLNLVEAVREARHAIAAEEAGEGEKL